MDVNTPAAFSLVALDSFVANTITGDNPAGTIVGRDFIIFDFADFVIDGGTDYTVLFFTDFAFSQREGTTDGGRIQFRETSTALNAAGTRDLHFVLQGTVIPEPGSLLLLLTLGCSIMGVRRRRFQNSP